MAEITVTANGVDLTGWFDATVERSIETIAGRFSFNTDFYPGQPRPVHRQDAVEIRIGDVLVMTGYVLAAEPYYAKDDIGLQVAGRDRTGDLAVCAALYPTGHWINKTLDTIARDLCQPYGITVVVDAVIGAPLRRFELNQGESVAEAISRAAKYRGVLVTRDDLGNLLLTTAGKTKAPAAIVLGDAGNVIQAKSAGSDDERFSDYICTGQAELSWGSDLETTRKSTAKDPHIMRYLPMLTVADTPSDTTELQQQAEQLARLHYARAQAYTYTVEGWEAGSGIWSPNTRVAVYDAAMGHDGNELLIVSTAAKADKENGDITEITVAPIEAWQQRPLPEPAANNDTSSGWRKRQDDGTFL